MMKNSVPLGRMGTKEEIANAAIFLLCNKYVSGCDVIVDGASWLMGPMGVPRHMVRGVSRGVETQSRGVGRAKM